DPSSTNTMLHFQASYLKQMKTASDAAGKRLIDVLDLHWYPEAHGTNNIRIINGDTSPQTIAARLQAPRSLWDPAYAESSWIVQNMNGQPIDLLHRIQNKIDTFYPG